METIDIRIEEDITPQKMIKRCLKKGMLDFLYMLNKLSGNKKRQKNKNNWKINIKKSVQ